MRIHLSRPDITDREIEAVCDVLRSPNLSLGPKLAEFEQAIPDFEAAVRPAVLGQVQYILFPPRNTPSTTPGRGLPSRGVPDRLFERAD